MNVNKRHAIKALPLTLSCLLVIGLVSTLNELKAFQANQNPAKKANPWGVDSLIGTSNVSLGAPSCSASACHGGPAAGVASLVAPRGSEYPLWIESDPHAKSWRTLNSERSVEILQRLGILVDGKIANQSAYQNCLACHNTSIELSSDGILPAIPEGVGCEACHGPSKSWRDSHYQGPLSVRESIEKNGLVNTKDELVRAKACTLCHVGGPDRDMNHDIIAAGHPALYFDYGTYLNAYPKHWRERSLDPNTQNIQRWLAGQLAKADSELELLQSRISKTHPHSTWPEFSNYQCTSCHQTITSSSLPNKPLTENRNPKSTLGKAPVRMWNLEGLLTADQVLGSDIQVTNNLLESIDQASSGSAPWATDPSGKNLDSLPRQIQAKREELIGLVSKRASPAPLNLAPDWTTEKLRGIAAQKWESAQSTPYWENAALAYLATLASSPAPTLSPALERMRSRLVFPDSTQSPVFPTPKIPHEIPYDATAELQSPSWTSDLILILESLGP